MKKIDFSRMERLRSQNLRIGYAVSIALVIAAFAWTIERSPLHDEDDGAALDAAEIPIERTTQSAPPVKPPPPVFTAADNIVEVEDMGFSAEAVSLSLDTGATVIHTGFTDGFNPTPAQPALPVPDLPEAAPIFKIVEEMPRFPGCEEGHFTKKEKEDCATQALLRYLGQQIRYPGLAQNNGIEGNVIVRFVVERDGSITGAEVIRDIGGGCGAEALRVVKSMPHWIPGKQQGRPVRVQFVLPVKFKLG